MMNEVVFISGIGTNVGKSYATGWYANILKSEGVNVITQKMIQTGNTGYSEDIDLHRKIMNIDYCSDDLCHLTAPVIMSYPASPHLAAKIDNCVIDLSIITNATNTLLTRYDVVLLEGAGGLMVPISDNYLTIDYIKDNNYPVILVTNGVLGSINHTLLSLEILSKRGITIKSVIYNTYFDEDKLICDDTINYISKYISVNYVGVDFLIMPTIK